MDNLLCMKYMYINKPKLKTTFKPIYIYLYTAMCLVYCEYSHRYDLNQYLGFFYESSRCFPADFINLHQGGQQMLNSLC